MACEFTLPFTGAAQDVLSKAKAAVQKQNGNFEGDESNGNFDISVFGSTIAGTYNVEGQSLNIIINSKPFMIPCSTIEGFLKGQLGI